MFKIKKSNFNNQRHGSKWFLFKSANINVLMFKTFLINVINLRIFEVACCSTYKNYTFFEFMKNLRIYNHIQSDISLAEKLSRKFFEKMVISFELNKLHN